jgi:hypothetical protein
MEWFLDLLGLLPSRCRKQDTTLPIAFEGRRMPYPQNAIPANTFKYIPTPYTFDM